jgi:hypothetical protein
MGFRTAPPPRWPKSALTSKSLPLRRWPPAFPPCLPIDDKRSNIRRLSAFLLRALELTARQSCTLPSLLRAEAPVAWCRALAVRAHAVVRCAHCHTVVPSRRHAHAVARMPLCRPIVPPSCAVDPVSRHRPCLTSSPLSRAVAAVSRRCSHSCSCASSHLSHVRLTCHSHAAAERPHIAPALEAGTCTS